MERWFISVIEHKGYLYWITEIGCHLMRMNLQSYKVEYLMPTIDKSLEGKGRSAVLCSYEDKILYVIERGERILLYDLENNSVKTLVVNCDVMYLNMYSYADVINNHLIIVPMYYHQVISIDLETGDVKKYDLLKNSNISNGFKQYFSHNTYQDNNILEIISTSTQEIILFSLLDMSILKRRKLLDNLGNIVNYTKYKDKYIILNDKNELMIIENDRCRILCQLDNISNGYLSLHLLNDYIWIMPLFAENIICFSMKDNSIEVFEKYPEEYLYTAPKGMGKFFGKCTVKNLTFFSMHSGTHILCINNETSNVNFLKVFWPNVEEDIKELKYQNRQILYEEGIPLSLFFKYIGIK